MTSTATYIHGTAPAEQERLALLNRLTNAAFLDFLQLQGNERVLEVGSGLGILTHAAAERLPRGTILGVEFSLEQLAAARENLAAPVQFLRADAHALPLSDACFDLTYCRYLLEHVADPVRVLRELRRVLKPGGRACVQENDILIMELHPECPHFVRMWQAFAELQTRLGGDARVGKKLFALFQAAGFREIVLSMQPETHWFGTPTFGPCMQNLAGNLRSGQEALVAQGLACAAELQAVLAELEAFEHRPDAAVWFYWHRAAGIK